MYRGDYERMPFHIVGLDLALKRKCPTCGKPLPRKPDYVKISSGEEIAICNECGDHMEAMHGIRHKARDDSEF